MKIQNGGPKSLVDLQKVKTEKETAKATSSRASQKTDQVSARLSQTLSSITEAIQQSGLTAGELHSNVNEDRAMALLGSFDRVGEGKQPRLPDAEILEMTDRLAEFLAVNPRDASETFNSPSRSRVQELLDPAVL